MLYSQLMIQYILKSQNYVFKFNIVKEMQTFYEIYTYTITVGVQLKCSNLPNF